MHKPITLAAALFALCMTAAAVDNSSNSGMSSSGAKTSDISGETAKKSNVGSEMQSAPVASKDFSKKDLSFARTASEGNQMEVDLGKLGVEKATNPQVKEFAQKLIDDHTKVQNNLTKVVPEKDLSMSKKEEGKEQKISSHLSKLSGDQFDKAFVEHMLTDHKKDIAEFQKFIKSGKNQGLKDFAQQTLSGLEEHLKIAQNLSSELGGKVAKGKTSERNLTPTGKFENKQGMKEHKSNMPMRKGSSSSSTY